MQKLTRHQQKAMNAIRGAHIYADGPRFDTIIKTTPYFDVPRQAMLRRLERDGLIKFSEVETTTLNGAGDQGNRVLLTGYGRMLLDQSGPRTVASSWYKADSENPRKRTRQLEIGDIILVPMLNGTKEWRKIYDIVPDKVLAGWRALHTADDMGFGASMILGPHPADRRWTVRRAEPATEQAAGNGTESGS